jgi:hypothetical protein
MLEPLRVHLLAWPTTKANKSGSGRVRVVLDISTGRSRFRQRQTTFCGFRKSPARESAREGSRGKVGFEDGAGAAPDFHKSAAPHFDHPVLTQ